MLAFIDTHTHNLHTENPFAVINLAIDDCNRMLTESTHRFFSVGIHPWYVHETDTSTIEKLEEIITDERVKAIGECGFDRNSKASFKEQGYFFERQVLLSEKFEKPLIIHCVAAFNELILLRKRLKPTQNWVIHGFRGKPELAIQLMQHGFALSYGPKFNTKSVEITALDKLCIETDESSTPIEELFRDIAAIKNCRPDELNAACRLLKLYVC
jgi:TatD DNase family protein